jgi:hypothetical protein
MEREGNGGWFFLLLLLLLSWRLRVGGGEKRSRK